MGIYYLLSLTFPSLEIRVEPDSTMTSGFQVNKHGRFGIVHREEDIKLKAPISIGCVGGTGNENLRNKVIEVS